MPGLKELQLTCIQGPGFASVKKSMETNGVVHFYLCGQGDVVAVEHPSSESMISAQCITDPVIHFSILSVVR